MAKKNNLPPIEVRAEELGPCLHRLHVKVPQARVEAEFGHAIQAAARSIKVPGFRPGKAPAHLIRGIVGDSVDQEARDHLFEHVVQEALVKSGLQPLRLLDFDPSTHEVEEHRELEFEVDLETAPEVELAAWDQVKVEVRSSEPTDEQVDQAVQSLAHDHPRFDAAEGAEVDAEHMAEADLRFRRGDEEGPSAEGLRLGLGSPLYGADAEAYEQALRGARAGDTRTLAIEFKEGFENADWVGTSGEAELSIKAVVKPRASTVEELIQDLELDGEEDLRGKVREQLARHNEAAERDRLAFEALEEMARMKPFGLPLRLVDEETEAAVKTQVERLKTEGGLSEDEAKAKVEEAREQLALDAERRLRHYFLVRRIAAKESVRVASADLDRAYRELATRHKADAKTVRAYYEEQGMAGQLRTDILEHKVRARLAAIVRHHNAAAEDSAPAAVESEARSE